MECVVRMHNHVLRHTGTDPRYCHLTKRQRQGVPQPRGKAAMQPAHCMRYALNENTHYPCCCIAPASPHLSASAPPHVQRDSAPCAPASLAPPLLPTHPATTAWHHTCAIRRTRAPWCAPLAHRPAHEARASLALMPSGELATLATSALAAGQARAASASRPTRSASLPR